MRILILLFRTGLMSAVLFLYSPVSQASVNQEKPGDLLKIGLLIPDNKYIAARQGAEMAIREANKRGGLNGRFFSLVVRSMEGPWGTGSKEAVNLIFEDEVLAILGSHDGRNAHLAEQACTKARVLFLSAWASDPTLAQAFVPWFFNCVTNDNQQADALIEELYTKRKFNLIGVVSDNGYDSKLALDNFIKKTKMAGKTVPVQFTYTIMGDDPVELPDQIKKENADCIVFFGRASMAIKLVQTLKQNKIYLPVFGSLALLDENESGEQELKNLENITMISSGHWFTTTGKEFRQEFQRIYGYMPGAISAYAYDGMNLIIEAIRNAGPDREILYKTMAKIRFEGVTGTIQFDDKGNRMGRVVLMQIKNGIPVEVE